MEAMRDDEPTSGFFESGIPEHDTISCELANGHALKIAAGLWSRWRTYEEWVSGIHPEPYFAIRIYCTENTLPKRHTWVEEYCEDTDFPRCNFDEIWEWLTKLCTSRELFQFDELGEFLDYVTDGLLHFAATEPDAVEHIRRLPEITAPESFDKVDDSIFNDQNDSPPEP